MARKLKRNDSEVLSEISQDIKHEDSVDDSIVEGLNSARVSSIKYEASTRSNSPLPSHIKTQSSRSSPASGARMKNEAKVEHEGDSIKAESPPATSHEDAKLSIDTKPVRSKRGTNKAPPRVAPLFDDLPDTTEEANSAYTVIDACQYQNKFIGFTEHAMECDCSEEWDAITQSNHACGEDSDCINRATKMECVGDCACGSDCQNQRFWRRLYANVSVIKTEKKGYGLRTNAPLKPGQFIYEYIGEAIGEGAFRKRMRQYDEEGIKHFYFMSLSKGEFVDATKKGNLGRFCNHSCNPNCYVDKWVVGDKLRMGIFAERHVRAGEELVFNYNVDRYGANPQPCYCGETNCTGFIGGKTQTERGTKLAAATIEALGIEDEDWDSWDTITAKKPRKKKNVEDDDEEYVESRESKLLDVDGVTKVMAALMQCKEKWIAVKLLERIEKSQDVDVMYRIIKLHGYRILNSQLGAWKEDENIIKQILNILDKLPRLTRNKIMDAKIDQTIEQLISPDEENKMICDNQEIVSKARILLDEWSKLDIGYRITRKVRAKDDPENQSTSIFDRRDDRRTGFEQRRSPARQKSPPRGPSGISAPTGPKAGSAPGSTTFRPMPFAPRGPAALRGPPPLPDGWFQATDENNRVYFYSATGETTWKRPSQPTAKPPPPPKAPTQHDMLKSIIDGIVTDAKASKDGRNATPDTSDQDKKGDKSDKWKGMDEEKQKKLYENTLFPHISHVMNKYKHKIPKDDLKRFAKDVAKKLVASDFKAGRVEDPTKISEKQQKKVKQYCKDFFDKAAAKAEQHKLRQHSELGVESPAVQSPAPLPTPITKKQDSDDEDVKVSDPDEDVLPEHAQNGKPALKRKIKDEIGNDDFPPKSPAKQIKLETPPPPPPPPPVHAAHESPDVSMLHEDHHNAEHEPDIHSNSNFKRETMEDVLKRAQEDEDDTWGMQDDPNTKHETTFEQQNGIKLENPLIQAQDPRLVKRERDRDKNCTGSDSGLGLSIKGSARHSQTHSESPVGSIRNGVTASITATSRTSEPDSPGISFLGFARRPPSPGMSILGTGTQSSEPGSPGVSILGRAKKEDDIGLSVLGFAKKGEDSEEGMSIRGTAKGDDRGLNILGSGKKQPRVDWYQHQGRR